MASGVGRSDLTGGPLVLGVRPSRRTGPCGMAGFCLPSGNIDIRSARTEDVEQLWPLVEEFAFSHRP